MCCALNVSGLQEVFPTAETTKTAAMQNSLGKRIGCSINKQLGG